MLQRGDESDNSATTAGIEPPNSVSVGKHNGQNWRLDWGPPGRRRPPHRSRKGVTEAVATRQVKSDPRSIVPANRGTKGRPMARPVPGRGETCDRGHPRCLSKTNGMHGASGYRVRMDAEYAAPLAGPTYRAHTRYRLAGPRSEGEKLPTGTHDRRAVPRRNPRPSGRENVKEETFLQAI